ncbi:DNA polymerase I-like, H3TH domain [Dillenia turbinata]|uniref:DNA polymerase I-like, H3TH domain n=1 Tax=Dillenia turbinata TaxID=194707 RepID=A0AAN8ZG57_9MAGN
MDVHLLGKPCLSPTPSPSLLWRTPTNPRSTSTLRLVPEAISVTESQAYKFRLAALTGSAVCQSRYQTIGGQTESPLEKGRENEEDRRIRKRVFFLDVNPLCYNGSTPCLHSFAHWCSLFFSQVSHSNPVVAVIDGERGYEYRRQLLPSYKEHRRKFSRHSSSTSQRYFGGSSQEVIADVLNKCNVPVVKVEGYEADDVIATLVGQVLGRGYRVVVASPDKDFKQLISEDVQIVMPMPDLGRWSFYTLKHYIAQYNIDPSSDLSLRCIMGDEVDGVPGIQNVVPSFGRKTAVKLIKKHGTLENLLNAAAVRSIGREYAQVALTKYADYLRRNYEVLALRRDLDIHLDEGWLAERDTNSDALVLSNFVKLLGKKLESH